MELSVTLVIVIVTALVSIQGFSKPGIVDKLKHYPYREMRNGEWYRLITSGFVHGGWLHLLINMFVLYEFGRIIEAHFLLLFGADWGRPVFVVFYLLAIVAGDSPTLFRQKDNPAYASIGASGAVSAVIFVFILFYPWELLYLYAILPIPAIVAGIGYLVYSSWASKRMNDNIDHLAHFYGAVFGVLFVIVLRPEMIRVFIEKAADLPI